MTVRVALIGCGAFAQLYHVPALLRDPRAQLAVIYDPRPSARTLEVAAKAKAPITARLDALWSHRTCDAVIVSTPHALHAQAAREALVQKCHVLVDKPFVLASREATELAVLAEQSAQVAAVAFNRRFDPACLRARELISKGSLGGIRHIETVQLGYPSEGWISDPALAGGGPFVGRGAHMADLIPWFVGRSPTRLRSRISPEPADGIVDRGGSVEVDFGDFIWFMTVRAGGTHMWDETRIYGEDAMIELSRPLGQPLGWSLTFVSSGHEEALPADGAEGLATINFLDATCGVAAPACTFADAWLSVRLIEAAYESAGQKSAWITV